MIPPPSTAASSPTFPLGECAKSIFLSSICNEAELIVVCVPDTVRLPATVKSPLMVTLSSPSLVSISRIPALPVVSKLKAEALSSIKSQSIAAVEVRLPTLDDTTISPFADTAGMVTV